MTNNLGILHQNLLDILLSKTLKIVHRGIEMQFFIPNSLNKYRIKTFSTKEPDTLTWIESFKKESVFWDIGSNIGLYSILAEKRFPEIKIFAFEPHPDAFVRLENNLRLNKSKNVISYNIALSNKNKKSFLSIENNHKKAFKNFQSGGAQVNDSGNIAICLSKGDDILKNTGDILGIKIDVEGHENLVISGINELLVKNKVFIQIEIHNVYFSKVNQILNDLGYNQIKKIGSHDYYYSNF
jgi:FkbM family methyltransferase